MLKRASFGKSGGRNEDTSEESPAALRIETWIGDTRKTPQGASDESWGGENLKQKERGL